MNTNAFKTMIIKAESVDAARNIAECLAVGGTGMFRVKLAQKLDRPKTLEELKQQRLAKREATHYISTGIIDSSFVALLQDADLLYTNASQSATLRGVILTATHDDCVNLVSTADVSDEQPMVALKRLNLEMI